MFVAVDRGGVGLGDARLDLGIVYVWVVVPRTPLPRRPRRVPDDHLDRQPLLALGPLAVVRQPVPRKTRPVRMQVESVRQHDAAEGLVGAVSPPFPVEGLLDVDRGDVVGEQHDLVGVQLFAVLPRQVLVPDQR